MAHSKDTADIVYHIRNKQKSAIKGSTHIQSFFQDEIGNNASVVKKNCCDESTNLLKDGNLNFGVITLKEVREKQNVLEKLNASPKQAYDKIRSIIRSPKVSLFLS